MSWGRGRGLSSELWWAAIKASCGHSSLESLKGGYGCQLGEVAGRLLDAQNKLEPSHRDFRNALSAVKEATL